MVLCDTNVIIEFFKGNETTLEKLADIGFDKIAISAITLMELYFGALNKQELSLIKASLQSIPTILIDHEISRKGIELIEEYSKSHNLTIPDALIASTAIQQRYKLFTYNNKDFKYILSLDLI